MMVELTTVPETIDEETRFGSYFIDGIIEFDYNLKVEAEKKLTRKINKMEFI